MKKLLLNILLIQIGYCATAQNYLTEVKGKRLYEHGGSACANSANIYSFTYGGKSYEVIRENKNWKDASACAVSRGGALVEINDAAEQTEIFTQLSDNANIDLHNTVAPDGGGGSYVWLGGNDLSREGEWVWDGNNDNNSTQFWQGTSTGNAVAGLYNNWGTEPDDWNGQDGLALALTQWPVVGGDRGSAGQWNDVAHTNTLYYVIEYPITTKKITIAGLTGNDKAYDGNTTASVTGTAALSGVEPGDDVDFGGTLIFTFASEDVGTGITINTTGYTLSGTDAAKYTLTQPTLSADITHAPLTIAGLTGNDKAYDGTTTASANGTASLTGVVQNDVVNLGGTPTFTFASADVGTGITINTTGYTISGTDVGNYTLTQPTLSADITIVTAVKDLIETGKELKLFPNPSDDYIQISGLTQRENYKIYNELGAKILVGRVVNNENIDVKNLRNGIYFLTIENGQTIKFIKE